MDWVIPGLLYAFFNSVVFFVNEKYRLLPALLGMYRGFGSALLALPFIFFVAPPTNPWFWFFLIIQGLMVGFFDYRIFASSARYGAGGTSMMTVTAILLTIVIWWFIDFPRLIALLHDPLVFLGIILSIAGCVFGYMRLAGGQLSRELLRYMWPAVLALVLMTLNSKNISAKATLEQTTLYYLFVIGLVGGVFNAAACPFVTPQEDKNHLFKLFFSRNYVKGGLLLLMCSVLLMVSKNIAMRSIPNPGFLNTLALTSPMWVMFINHVERVHSRICVSDAVFTLACIAMLIFFTHLPLPAVIY